MKNPQILKLLFFVLIVSLCIGISCDFKSQQNGTKKIIQKNYQHPKAINPNISKEANVLLDFLYQIKGKYILSGHHNMLNAPTQYHDDIQKITNTQPVVWGSDFLFTFGEESPEVARQKMIDKAIVMHNRGHIITLMWHSCFPSNGDSCSQESIWVWKDVVSRVKWDSLTTKGTKLNQQWRLQADKVAVFLKQLQKAKIPVLWRPYHEMNGVWFWWCQQPGEEGFVKLWRMMYDYYTNHHKLNNLIWVWNANAPRSKQDDEAYSYIDYFPGIDYVDILAADVYHNDYKKSHQDGLLGLAQGKLIALGEVGRMPTPEILDQQDQWTWFMGWADWLQKENKPDSVRILYESPRVLTLDQLKRTKSKGYEIVE